MEVAIGGNGTTPFQREVREWQHVDPNTGALLTGRLEADRWVNGPLNAYGKVVDSKNVSQPNGTQHTQRKQFEVLQARTSSGSLQVVRAQTVHKSSSRWSSDIRSVATGNYNTQNFGENTSLTNGYHSPLENGHEEDSQTERFANSKKVSRSSHSSSPIIPTSSVKLSALIKNDERKNPHSISNSLTLVQQQEYLKEQKQKFYTAPSDHTGSERKHVVDIFNGTSQNMSDSGISINFHVRGKSVSTDDLSIEWDQNEEDPESPSAWRRVSKIRRSFQFPKSSSPKPSSNRPSDLPENSVSVSRIRQELENGRRLHSDIRNNHEDRTSFDNILHGTVSQEDAESLKEIRGKLRKLSDESLYKDDFITDNTHNLSGNDHETTNHIIIQKETDVVSRTQEYSVQQPVVLQDSQIVSQKPSFLRRDKPPENSIYSTNSLEGRSKYRDMTSAEWHLRRKSYGFEKMVPSTDSMFRMETSTDSGIGRSSELANWSPTETQSGATVIMFGDKATPKSTLTFLSGKDASNASSVLSSFSSARQFFDSKLDVQEVKRHSIAVDESKYVRDNLKEVFDTKTSVHLNGLYNKDLNLSQASVSDENSKRTKRVEFCKTEVHFAAESGRVNIVETDGKPPPTNNFRRRRRTPSSSVTSAYLEAIHSGIPVTHFGDEQKPSFENDQKGTQEGSLSPMKANNVTVSTPFTSSETVTALKNAVLEEEDESAFSEEISLRGILKNKPVKPRPYHLGENIENSESLWGVRLKPIPSSNTAPIRLNNIENKDSAAIKDVKNDVKTILERVQTVEQRKNGSSFSTKVNLNMSDPLSSWEPPELQDSNVMSIEFNSPPSSLTRNPESSGKIMANRSHPKPRSRNLSPAKGIISHPTAHEQEKLSSVKQKAVSQRVGHKNEIISEANKLPLKVGEGGARKLREHELSYFGVKVKANGETKVITYRPEEDKRNISENYRKQLTNKNDSVSVQKHKLPSDKPDLLKHSPKAHHVQSTNYNSSKTNCVPEVECNANNREDNDPIYENIDEIAPYNRKGDLERDEMILSEMTREAHLSLKPLKERKSGKGESSRSSSMKSHKPLDTIQETKHTKQSSHSQQMREHLKNHERSIKSKIVQVPQVSHDVVQRPCRANRTSSISSNDSLTRSPRASFSRQRSASKEKEVAEVHNAKRQSSVIRECAKLRHRSSSRDSKANASSSEEQSSKHAAESLRKIRRVKSKDSSKPVEKCEHKLHQSRQAIVTSTTRASTISDDARKVKCSPSSRHRNELDKSSSRRQDKSSGKERSSSTSRSRSSSTATEHQKSRTKTAGIVPTTSRSSKHDSNRIQRKK